MQHVGLRTKPPSRGHISEHTQIHAEGGIGLPQSSLGSKNLYFFKFAFALRKKKILEARVRVRELRVPAPYPPQKAGKPKESFCGTMW